MVAAQTLKLDIETNLRVKHKVLYIHSSHYETSLKNTCSLAEADGMSLVRAIDIGNYVVLVFMGGKNFMEGANGEE